MADINVAQFSSVPGARIVGRRTSQPISGYAVPLDSVQGQAYLSGTAPATTFGYPAATYGAYPAAYGAYPAASYGAFRPSVTYAGATAAPATYGYGVPAAQYAPYGAYGARYGAYAPRNFGYYEQPVVRTRRSRRSRRSRSTRRPRTRSRRSRRL